MEKEYIAGEPQRYEIGGRVFIVEPRYRKDGESMADILLKLMFADLDEEMRAANKTTTDYLTEYENLDELNHLAHLISELDSDEIETLEAVLNKGDHTSSVADIINLVHNLDCYELHPGVTDDETLGRIYVEEMELLDVPDNVLPYFDFEAYGRDMRINEGGHFAPTGYLTRSGDFKEVYHGIEDIPAEHRIFAYPKLNIREQMAAYKEVIDRSSLEGERLHPRNEHDDR